MKFKTTLVKEYLDQRGGLIALQEDQEVPFGIKRVYYIYGAPADTRRGFHAHRQLQQFAVCVKGSCKMLMDDGVDEGVVSLDRPTKGLLIDKMVWHEMFDFSEDCVLMVVASELFDPNDYIGDKEEFYGLVRG